MFLKSRQARLDARTAKANADAFIRELDEEMKMIKHNFYSDTRRTTEEILKALELYDWATRQKDIEQPEPELLTREEATKIIASIALGRSGPELAKLWVDALEALGLLKFKKEEIRKLYHGLPIELYHRHPIAIEAIVQAGFEFKKS